MMNAEQKERIAKLRDNGAGYTEIANALGLPVNTVKTFCRRNGLTGDRRDIQPKKKSKGSRTIDLLYRKNRGNTTVPEDGESLENTGVSGVPAVCTITLSFSDSPDEAAVADVMNMLMTADYDQAEKDFENAQKQVSALEEEAVKALTGESQLDLSVVNAMLVKHRTRLETAQQAMVDAQAKLEAETQSAKETKAQIDELLSWADCFDKANTETKHMIMARLIDRVELAEGYKVHIRFKISMDQFQGTAASAQ